ncbi:unnamed protein product, partial [Urochloa humidicola]
RASCRLWRRRGRNELRAPTAVRAGIWERAVASDGPRGEERLGLGSQLGGACCCSGDEDGGASCCSDSDGPRGEVNS